jgi:hypothetical protein
MLPEKTQPCFEMCLMESATLACRAAGLQWQKLIVKFFPLSGTTSRTADSEYRFVIIRGIRHGTD